MSQSLAGQDKTAAPEPVYPVGDHMPAWKKALHIGALTALAVGSVGFLWIMSSLPRVEGRVPIKGLDLPGTVSRDPMGIPAIAARSTHDAYFILGWLHAQDRIWQMEMSRRTANGTLAEVVGEPGLANDRFMRTLGLADAARRSASRLDNPTREAFEAYSAGINGWISSYRYRLPPQFGLLSHQPDPWTVQDSLAIARLMAFQLSNSWQDQILKARMSSKLEPRRLMELWPGPSLDGPISLSSTQADTLFAAIPPQAEPHLASNVWVVSGQKTASGKPLLANDPHLNFTAPSPWYLAAIKAPGLVVSGATLPGLPMVMIGRNDRIAWGITSTHADVVDVVLEQARMDGQTYMLPKGPDTFRTRTETIRIRGGKDVALTVRETRHGPVISDLAGAGWTENGQVLALRSPIFAGDDLSVQSMLKINQAVDWRSFNDALKDLQSPVLNFAYADTSGNIGMVTAGFIPLRKDGDTTLPMRGWIGEGDWKGRIPFDKLPRQYNPPGGSLVNANNRVTGKSYPFAISASWPSGYRAQRIVDMLEDRKDLTPSHMQSMQTDVLSLANVELKGALSVTNHPNPLTDQAARMLDHWDGLADRNRPEPLIFNLWIQDLWRRILADELGDQFKSYSAVRTRVLLDILTRNRHWCDDITTPEAESCDQIAAQSLDHTIATLTAAYGNDMLSWRWGTVHRAQFSDPVIDTLPLLGRWLSDTVETDGDAHTVNVGSFAGNGFAHIHGAGSRMVFDLSSPYGNYGIVSGGQAGNPLSRHSRDMLDDWQAGRLYQLTPSDPRIRAVLTLEPGY